MIHKFIRNSSPLLAALLPVAASVAVTPAPIPSNAQHPNIVFILADDLGWKDLGCYGAYSFETPNIDRLCSQGMKFTQAYSYVSSSPTRASMMTGMDPARLGITAPVCHQDQVILEPKLPRTAPHWQKLVTPEVVTRLDTKFVSYAKLLKEAGYVTAHFGKWHLGREPYSPLQHGFDVDVPHTDAPGPPGTYIGPWNPKFMAGFKLPSQPGEHLEDHMAREATAFIEQNKNKPFILDYWAFSVHSPLSAKDEYVNKYKNIANFTNPQRNPVYASMVKSLDDAVGTLMDALKKAGIADKTIIIFGSDNGGLGYWEGNRQHPEYAGIPATCNSPLREGKGWVYEGGTRVPLIVSWPGVTKPGSVSNALVSSMDMYPTLLEIGGKTPLQTQPLDGVSFVPVLKGLKTSARTKAYFVFPQYCRNYVPRIQAPAAWVHEGDWKLIRFFLDNNDNTDRVELYNVKDDLGENFDMSLGAPNIVTTLSKKLDAYLASINVMLPQINPNYDPKALDPLNKRTPSEPVIAPPDGD